MDLVAHSFDEVVEQTLPLVMQRLSVVAGLAIVENPFGETAVIAGIIIGVGVTVGVITLVG